MKKHLFFSLILLPLHISGADRGEIVLPGGQIIHPEFPSEEVGEMPGDPSLNDLVQAARIDDIKKVERQLAKGLDINGIDEFGWSPVLAAASKARTAMVQALVAKGADINRQYGKDNITALIQATLHEALHGPKGTVEALLKLGAKPNIQYDEGETALHIAAFWSSIPITDLLLRNKVNVHVKRNDGKTAFDIAESHADKDKNAAIICFALDAHAHMQGSTPSTYLRNREIGAHPRVKKHKKIIKRSTVDQPDTPATPKSALDAPWPRWNDAHNTQNNQKNES